VFETDHGSWMAHGFGFDVVFMYIEHSILGRLIVNARFRNRNAGKAISSSYQVLPGIYIL
jgi:hypothetical protein